MRFTLGISLIIISYIIAMSSAVLLLVSAKVALMSYLGSWAILGSGMHLAGPKAMRKVIAGVLRR